MWPVKVTGQVEGRHTLHPQGKLFYIDRPGPRPAPRSEPKAASPKVRQYNSHIDSSAPLDRKLQVYVLAVIETELRALNDAPLGPGVTTWAQGRARSA